MKKSLLMSVLMVALPSASSFGQQTFEMKEGDTTFVMQQYFMCFLFSGDVSGYDSLQMVEIQAGHLAHLNRLAEDDKISIAGPFGDNKNLRGIVIFHVATIEEAKELEAEDPAIKAGVLTMEIRPWWAAKGSVLK